MKLYAKLDLYRNLYWCDDEGFFKIVDKTNDTEIRLSFDALISLNNLSAHMINIKDSWFHEGEDN